MGQYLNHGLMNMKNPELTQLRKALRTAVADYMRSEGCSCCRDTDGHEKHTKALAQLLNVTQYSDGSGYDFTPYQTKDA